MKKPDVKPLNPNFSSGPCSKRPGWNLNILKNSSIGRSHRSQECKSKLNEIITKSKKILNIPDSYFVGIMPASDTGALESALWSLLGFTGVEVLAWENFGKDWVIDILEQLKIKNVKTHIADYGNLPDLNNLNFKNDIVFTWNGTTSGVCVPNSDWIPENREGLTFCDATSAVFAMKIDFNKLDIITWSWQKVLGGEAAHGMIALSPKAIKRLEKYTPPWPIPKIFRIANKNKIIKGIFEGSTINTPSMICVEDALDSLNWIDDIGGYNELIKRSNENLKVVSDWIAQSDWIEFLNADVTTRSCTSITLKINNSWFTKHNENDQRLIIKKMIKLLEDENVAFDINGYNKAPPSLRLWGGATVESSDLKKLFPWLDWSFDLIKNNA